MWDFEDRDLPVHASLRKRVADCCDADECADAHMEDLDLDLVVHIMSGPSAETRASLSRVTTRASRRARPRIGLKLMWRTLHELH